MAWRERMMLRVGLIPTTGPLGPRAEAVAARHLKKAGLKILAKNLRLYAGEIDILALDRATDAIVIVEVKATSAEHPPPEVHVNYAKRKKLTQLARELEKRPGCRDRVIRFDIVAIVWPAGERRPTRVTHYPAAFEATR